MCPILESLDICADVSGNRTVGDVLLEAKDGVREGRPLADPLREHEDVIPTLVVQMIEVGEQTGALDQMLRKVGEFYDQEVEVTVNNLTALLEPLLTVFMGAMVGAMVICLYLPMFDYIKLVPNSGELSLRWHGAGIRPVRVSLTRDQPIQVGSTAVSARTRTCVRRIVASVDSKWTSKVDSKSLTREKSLQVRATIAPM